MCERLHGIASVYNITASKSIDEIVLLNIDLAHSIQSSGRSLIVDGFSAIDRQFILYNYSSWLLNTNLLPSYPWLPTDANVVTVSKENIDTSLSDYNLKSATALQTVLTHNPDEEDNSCDNLIDDYVKET